MIKHESRVNIWQVAAIIAVALFLFGLWTPIVRFGVDAYEDAMFRCSPSAQRAYEYGNRHFSATKSSEYDIDRAELFFKRALALDPQLPYVHHQLARIAFLRGDFRNAMWHINKEIEMNRSPSASSYYVRGLIEGFRGNYEDSAKDYERYLESDPSNWAAINDYAWVLLKANRPAAAAAAAERGLVSFPDNAWLLNTSAIALYETGDLPRAKMRAEAAVAASRMVTEREWLTAYPGNDPKIAKAGIATLQKASQDNMHTILLEYASSTVQ